MLCLHGLVVLHRDVLLTCMLYRHGLLLSVIGDRLLLQVTSDIGVRGSNFLTCCKW